MGQEGSCRQVGGGAPAKEDEPLNLSRASAGSDKAPTTDEEKRAHKRRLMFEQIELKVERGGTSSLTADEFQMMHESLNEMVANGDTAVREASEEEIAARKLEREERRKARKERLAQQQAVDARIRSRLSKNQYED
mmetsp:Transcript_41513/g.81115  ORF Transcript_41513/g.81115 Transcript_41513/m.81115 type:complete len:136 (-) Transcript_41513:93-500(-)